MTEKEHKENEATAEQPANGVEDVESLRGRLREAEETRDRYLNLAKQKQAEFENYQKRVQRDVAQERRFAHMPLVRDLLSALDNLERAIAADRKKGEDSPLAQGVAMVYNQLLDALRKHEVVQIPALGQPFDPNVHEAVAQVPGKDHAVPTVVDVLEQGYMIHDRVVRPARVAVSVPPPQST
jgi:molecular chaperone GrpE